MKNLFYFSQTNTQQVSKGNFYFGLLAVLILTVGLLLAQIYPGYILTDGGIFTAIAFKVQHGATLYLDAWENKPPAIFYLLIVFFTIIKSKIYATFLMVVFVAMLASLYLYKFYVLKLNSIVLSVLLSLLTMVFLLLPNNFGDGLYTEFYGTVSILISCYFNAKFELNNDIKNARLSLLFAGLSFWFKEPFIIMALMLYFYTFFNIKEYKQRAINTLYFIAPSVLFLLLLFLSNSLIPFIKTLQYNFLYTGETEAIEFKQKWNDFNANFITHIPVLIILFLYYFIVNIQTNKFAFKSLFWLGFFIASCVFIYLSPYNFGHYYLPSFTVFFIVLIQLYTLNKERVKSNFILLLFLCISVYKVDSKLKPQFEFVVKESAEDAITRHLKGQKDKTLFVDCVEYGSYYVKTNLLYNTFVPVALPVHFKDNNRGIENRKRIWKELSQKPSDYLIKNYTTGFYYWNLPHNGFYDTHYKLIDSTVISNSNTLYLYQYKK